MDLSLAGAGLLVVAPLMAALAAAIRLEDGGSPLYIQERVGQDGEPFQLLKFRTMSEAPLAPDATQLTVGDDPRITRVGRLLRSSRLDELPQLINILAGEMSVVGPRPEVPRYVAHYDAEQRAVLSARPGLTDPATLAFRHEAEILAGAEDPERTYIEEVMPEKLRINLEYLAERDAVSDLKLLLATATTLLADHLEGREG